MSGNIVACAFSYGSVPLAVACEARNLAERPRTFEGDTKESAITFGRELIAIKEKIGHGNFGSWVEAELPFGVSELIDLMKAAGREYESAEITSRIPPVGGAS